jgi:transposase
MNPRQALGATNRQRSIKAQETRAEVLARAEKPASQIAAEVGISVRSVHRHIAQAREEMIRTNRDSVIEWRNAQLDELNKMREILADNKISAGRRIELTLAILREEIKLCGTAAPSQSVSVNVTPSSDLNYLKFKSACANLTEAQLQQVFDFAASLVREPKVTVRDASWFPEPTKQLGDGE